jgi:hypothetical protein
MIPAAKDFNEYKREERAASKFSKFLKEFVFGITKLE